MYRGTRTLSFTVLSEQRGYENRILLRSLYSPLYYICLFWVRVLPTPSIISHALVSYTFFLISVKNEEFKPVHSASKEKALKERRIDSKTQKAVTSGAWCLGNFKYWQYFLSLFHNKMNIFSQYERYISNIGCMTSKASLPPSKIIYVVYIPLQE